MSEIHGLCVFCGSRFGREESYRSAAGELGGLLGREGIRLVYGGGHVGLMGVVADATLKAGGKVTGVIPRHLQQLEVGHDGLSDLRVVDSMHERKALMADLSDAFAVLPGGIGTMEEFFEVWTWGQLGIHAKPYGLLNVGGYFDPLIRFLDHMVSEDFLRDAHRDMLVIEANPEKLLARLREKHVTAFPKRIDRSEI